MTEWYVGRSGRAHLAVPMGGARTVCGLRLPPWQASPGTARCGTCLRSQPEPLEPDGWVCVCCLQALANDDTTGHEISCSDPAGVMGREPSHGWPLSTLAAWADGRQVVPGDSDLERDFSRTQCVGCGTDLAGSRHPVHVI